MRTRRPAPVPAVRAGFSLVEVVIAIVILAVGVLGLAGTTALVVRQVTLGEMTTKRAAAFQTAIEQMRALEWEEIGGGSTTVGDYVVSWWVDSEYTQSKVMKIATLGPGVSTSGGFPTLVQNVADTFTYRLLRY